MNERTSERGFIALMSTIVIAAILLAMIGSTEFASFYARADALGIENKRSALALADSCINIVLLALATSTDPADFDVGGHTFVVNNDSLGEPRTCTIGHFAHVGSTVNMEAYAAVNNSDGSASVIVTLPPHIQITSWNDH